jgi:hypothetical protein
MPRFVFLALALALLVAVAHGRRDLQGIKVTVRNDPTKPIFRSETSGGINIAGKGIDIENERTITAVNNIDKHTGVAETTFVSYRQQTPLLTSI